VKVLDLFSGIGGFSLGLERAGFETVAFCEPNPFCQAILKKHWATVPVYEDVRELSAERLANDGIAFDAICGGFPCQDISVAGKGAGLAGARSGLWWEFHRLIAETKPKWVIAENVSALRSRGLDEVLGSLAALGYDAEWHCIPASAVGAPHRRDRIWIVAYPNGQQQQPMLSGRSAEGSRETASTRALDVDVAGGGADGAWSSNVADAGCESTQVSFSGRFATVAFPQRHPWWEVEPDVGRVADGVPKRLDRLKSLGNAVVPQIPEIIGRVINDPAADR
jgi:DNA (cytosine-5)-methyltransferase 1